MPQIYAQYPAKHTTKSGKTVTINSYMPERYPQGVGDLYIGEVAGYTYVPAMNGGRGGYREGGAGTPKDPNKKPSIMDQVKPVVGTTAAFAGAQALFDQQKRKTLFDGVSSLGKDVYDLGKTGVQKADDFLTGLLDPTPTPTTAPVAPTASPAATPTSTAGLLEGTVPSSTPSGGMSLVPGGGIPEGAISVPMGEAVPSGYTGIQTMADGSTVAVPEAGGFGISPLSGALSVAAYYGPSVYAHGKEILSGDPGRDSAVKGALLTNPITGWAVPLMDKFGIDLGRKTTESYQFDRRKALAEKYPRLLEAGFLSGEDVRGGSGVWEEGKYAGESWTFERLRDAVINPESEVDETGAIGLIGNFETFGEKWVHVPLEKQKSITKRLMEEGLYTSTKGDVIIADENQERAQLIFDEEMGLIPEQVSDVEIINQPNQSVQDDLEQIEENLR